MDYFLYKDHQLHAEEVPLSKIAADFGTPTYVYSRRTLERHWHAFDKALSNHPHLICYAVKANSNLAVLNLFARLGSGFDIVSGGELTRVIAAGGDPSKVVFSGVGKTQDEMRQALNTGIKCFNVESDAELRLLADVAEEMHIKAPVSLRVNPDVDAGTHPYISTGLKENKFGIPDDEALALYEWADKHAWLEVVGIDCHIGSQLTELEPFLLALDSVVAMMSQLEKRGIRLKHMDLGGGLGVPYQDEVPPEPDEYAAKLLQRLESYTGYESLEIILEPGRAIAANAGILLTHVQYLKANGNKNFAIVDAAMNDLIRPSLYQAWQAITPVNSNASVDYDYYDVVGPVCETGDFLGKQRRLAIQAGDLLAVRSAGAYGFVMSSNYNSRTRPAEVMVDGDQVFEIRERELVEHLTAGEKMLP